MAKRIKPTIDRGTSTPRARRTKVKTADGSSTHIYVDRHQGKARPNSMKDKITGKKSPAKAEVKFSITKKPRKPYTSKPSTRFKPL